MTTAFRPDSGTLLIVQRVEEGGAVAVEVACGCVLVYEHWLRDSEARPLQTSDILSVTNAASEGVSVHQSSGGAEPEAPMYVLGGQATLEEACDSHSTPAA